MNAEISIAKTFLAEEFPSTFVPDEVKERLGLTITGATLGRKFREAAAKGELVKDYYTTPKGRRVVKYAYNPAYHQTPLKRAVSLAVRLHRMIMGVSD